MKNNRIILLLFLFLIIPFIANSQIQPTPKSYQKIKFIYLKKSNFKLDEKGFYADTIQLKTMFPYLGYEKTVRETGDTIGFVPIAKLKIYHQKIILEKMTQNNTVIYGTFDKKKNIVSLSIDHSSPETDFAYQLFGFPQNKLFNKEEFVYQKELTQLEIKSNGASRFKSIKQHKILWQNEEKTIGQFVSREELDQKTLNFVAFQKELPRLVSPIPIFENVNYGVKTIYAMEYHYELISVSYE